MFWRAVLLHLLSTTHWRNAVAEEVPAAAFQEEPYSAHALWPDARLLIAQVDAGLEASAAAVLDELERKTWIRVVRGDASGLSIRAGAGGFPSQEQGARDLCCFDPAGGARQLGRAMVSALLVSLGLAPPASSAESNLEEQHLDRGDTSASNFTNEEADMVNKLYATALLPGQDALPAKLEVGILQLAQNYDPKRWEAALNGQGRRLVASTMRLSRQVASWTGLTVEGALPNFVFRGNKAEVIFLGPDSAKLLPPDERVPTGNSSEGLGAGVRRHTEFALSNPPGFRVAVEVPTYLGDGSVLALKVSSTVQSELMTQPGLDANAVLQDHRGAMSCSRASAWAQANGALMGFPTFLPLDVLARAEAPISEKDMASTWEVVVILGPGQTFQKSTPPPVVLNIGISVDETLTLSSGGLSLGQGLVLLWTTMGCVALALRLKAKRRLASMTKAQRAELDLQNAIGSL